MTINGIIELVNRKTKTINEMTTHNRELKRVINDIRGISYLSNQIRDLINLRIDENNENIKNL